MENRQQILNALANLYNGLVRLENATAQKQNTEALIQNLQYQIQQNNSQSSVLGAKNKFKRNAIKNIATVVAIVFCALAFFILPMAVGAGVAFNANILLTMIVLVLAARGIAAIVGRAKTGVEDLTKVAYDCSIPNLQNQLQAAINSLPALRREVGLAYADVAPMMNEFPRNYRYSYAVGKIYEYFDNLRANTIQEALNLYENDVKFNQLMSELQKQTEIARQTLAEVQQISSEVSQIRANTDEIRNNTANIAKSSAECAAYLSDIRDSQLRHEADVNAIRNFVGV